MKGVKKTTHRVEVGEGQRPAHRLALRAGGPAAAHAVAVRVRHRQAQCVHAAVLHAGRGGTKQNTFIHF